MRSALVAPWLLVVSLTGSAMAQTGSFTLFGNGCAGTGTGLVCASNNPSGGTFRSTHNANRNEFALPVDAKTTLAITGFELYTQAVNSAVTIQTRLFAADASGRPTGSAIRSGTMRIGTSAGFYTTTFAPLTVRANERVFLSYTPVAQMYIPSLTFGQRSMHYWRMPNGRLWNGPFNSAAWSWKVRCAAILRMTNTGNPTVGKTFSIQLDGAKSNTAAGMLVGASKSIWGAFQLPLDLTGLGAPGCTLLCSVDLIVARAVDASGKVTHPVPIPNIASLVGLVWHDQWAVLDSGANALGIAFSNGATVVVGR